MSNKNNSKNTFTWSKKARRNIYSRKRMISQGHSSPFASMSRNDSTRLSLTPPIAKKVNHLQQMYWSMQKLTKRLSKSKSNMVSIPRGCSSIKDRWLLAFKIKKIDLCQDSRWQIIPKNSIFSIIDIKVKRSPKSVRSNIE